MAGGKRFLVKTKSKENMFELHVQIIHCSVNYFSDLSLAISSTTKISTDIQGVFLCFLVDVS